MLEHQLRRAIKFLSIIRNANYRRALLFSRVAAAVEHEPVLRSTSPLCIIDVGANKGQFALVVSNLFPESLIYAFEPLDEPRQNLVELFELTRNMRIHSCALGANAGTSTIHISRRADSSSLLEIGDEQTALFPGTYEVGTREIIVARGDDILSPTEIRRPSLLKIDVQGFELSVLEGFVKMFDYIDFIYVELSFSELYKSQAVAHEVINWLSDHNYILRGVYNTFYDRSGVAAQADMLFCKATTHSGLARQN